MQGPVIIIPQAAPNFFTPNGTLESIELLSHPREAHKNCMTYIGV